MTKPIPWWNTEFTDPERQALLNAFEAKRISMGAVTEELEQALADRLQIPYVVVTPSGTAALTMALLAIGVKAGDEVIVPDLTWLATAQAAALLGAHVVLVDCFSDSPLMNPEEAEKKVTERTKAIIPVHLNGRACDMAAILRIGREHRIAVIEDSCKALLSRTPQGYLGTLGDLGCFSLGMISLVSAGYGGAVVTKDKERYRHLKLLQNHGVSRDLRAEELYASFGYNFRMSDLLAAIALSQLKRVDEKLRKLHEIYRRYCEGLADISELRIIPVHAEAGEVPLCVETRSPEREQVISFLKQQGVETMRFHLPLHRARYFHNPGEFPHATRFAKEGFMLPSGPAQTLDDIDRCVDILRNWVGAGAFH